MNIPEIIAEIKGQIEIEQGIARMKGEAFDWQGQSYHQGIETGLTRALSILDGTFGKEEEAEQELDEQEADAMLAQQELEDFEAAGAGPWPEEFNPFEDD